MPRAFLLRYQEACPPDPVAEPTLTTQTSNFVKSEQRDADPGTHGGRLERRPIKIATMTATEVGKEQRDRDVRSSAARVVPSQPNGGPAATATRTATKVRAEASDPDASARSGQVVPRGPGLHE